MVIKINKDTVYVETNSGQTSVIGTYTATADSIVVNDVSGPFACIGKTGKYKYTITANRIKFDLIEDTCDGRIGMLTTAIWQRSK